MIIDSHVHTCYSKHASGSVDRIVEAALEKGIEILTITDHAPFYVDPGNRLLESELERYFRDIQRAQSAHRGEIKILSGLELDYMPGYDVSAARLLARYDLDFAMASIHYIPMPIGDPVKVWELDRINRETVLKQYFLTLSELVKCRLFDAVGHADTLLRVVPDHTIVEYMAPLVGMFAQCDVAYELNASGLRKTAVDPLSGLEVHGRWSYPSRSLFPMLISAGTRFTIGSDAHSPKDVGAGVQALVDALLPLGLTTLSYFEKRQRVDIDAVSVSSLACP